MTNTEDHPGSRRTFCEWGGRCASRRAHQSL